MVQYQSTQDFSNVRVILDKEFDAIIAKRDDENKIVPNEWVESKVNHLDFAPSELTAVLCNVNDDIAQLRSLMTHKFDGAAYGAMLQGATIEFDREFVEKGNPIPRSTSGRVAERNCYSTNVTKVECSDNAKVLMEAIKVELLKKAFRL